MKFYVPKDSYDGMHSKYNRENQVYTVSGDHHSSGWVTLGYVSRQTPHGQGTYCGFLLKELREATPDEVLDALERDHPHGADFRPHCREAMGASFHLVMSSAISNWTNDRTDVHPPILNMSRQEIIDYGKEAQTKHNAMLARWGEITAEQRIRIRALFPEEGT